jgi:dihydroxy-acid dehydratase
LVRDGDLIELDVPARRLDLLVDDDELGRRRQRVRPSRPSGLSGYGGLFVRHVTQANLGCDFDFIGALDHVAEPLIY